jgi:hypothetical protein
MHLKGDFLKKMVVQFLCLCTVYYLHYYYFCGCNSLDELDILLIDNKSYNFFFKLFEIYEES